MKIYNVDSAFEMLKHHNITTHKESVRRWLRNGDLKGITPSSRKVGWRIKEDDLWTFIESRTPKGNLLNEENIKRKTRENMWWELVQKNIFEGYIDIRKTQVRTCIEHLGYSKEFETFIWEVISKNKRGYKTPRIPYLLEAFLFDSKRILLDKNYNQLEDQIPFDRIFASKKIEPLIQHWLFMVHS